MTMTKVILYIAVTQDGFIADKQGGVDWLDAYNAGTEDYGFDAFYNSVDALVMGDNTYKQIVSYGAWPFEGASTFVFASKTTPATRNEDIELIKTDVPEFMNEMKEDGFEALWLVGGAQLIESFYKADSIDEYILTIVPHQLGEGLALPLGIFEGQNLTLVDTKKFPSGVIQKHYKK